MSTLYEAAQAVKAAIEAGNMSFQTIEPLCAALDAKPEVVKDLVTHGLDGAVSDYLFASYLVKREAPGGLLANYDGDTQKDMRTDAQARK